MYSKKIPTREALHDYQNRVRRQFEERTNELRTRKSVDVEKTIYSHEWVRATNETSLALDKKCKESSELLFSVGAIFECTFNKEGVHSQSQRAILFDLPNQEDLDQFRCIKLLLAPPGYKQVAYDPDASKESYLDNGFVEISVGCAPERINNVLHNKQAQRKQYGLKHHISGTIHSAMGDTLPSVATSISVRDQNYTLWDKGQLLVIISRTKYAKDTIFVGEKEGTLDALVSLLKCRTQWTDYMERILRIVTINSGDDNKNAEENRSGLDQSSYPFRVRDICLPQDNTGYVYMLISVRTRDFVYIGKTKSLQQRLRAHNSGNGSVSTEPSHLRPYALFAYICGFDGNNNLMYYVEQKWKEVRDRLVSFGNHDPRQWARQGVDAINLDYTNFGANSSNDLRLVLLFR